MMSSLSVAVVLCIRCFPSCSPSPCFFFVSSFLFPWSLVTFSLSMIIMTHPPSIWRSHLNR